MVRIGWKSLLLLLLLLSAGSSGVGKREPQHPPPVREPEIIVPVMVEDTAEDAGASDGWDERAYVLCVLTAEAGGDRELCLAVTQCLWNACDGYGWAYSPAEVMWRYRYTYSLGWWSEEAEEAYRMIFEDGYVYEAVGEATLFYAPRYCESAWHESQDFVCEISGVRFFKER